MLDKQDTELLKKAGQHGNHFKKTHCSKCDKETIVRTTGRYCHDCTIEKFSQKSKATHVAHKAMKASDKERKCLFCEQTEKLNIHHVDKNNANNCEHNLVYLCNRCHIKLHGKIYNPLLKRVFRLLVDDRHTYQDIATFFGTTKQNVYQILTKKSQANAVLTNVK